ncbi:MAG TPA: hypothetical protein EYP14_06730, partial [Planctomycetaceae bacterium]|nr:hypothetical protein [Planctomycetaceae bacterium]
RQRIRLLNRLLVGLSDAELERTTVVFDASQAGVPGTRSFRLHGLTVVFAADADEEIERLIAAHSAPRRLQLVSDDRRLQKAARRRRATVLSCDAFLRRLRQSETGARPGRALQAPHSTDPKYTGRISERELADWLEVFGHIPEASELSRELDFWQRRVAELDQTDGEESEDR